mgnify:CR=1 FL=1
MRRSSVILQRFGKHDSTSHLRAPSLPKTRWLPLNGPWYRRPLQMAVSQPEYAPRNRWKATGTHDGDSFLKDYGQNPFLARWYGRLCLHWEEAALRRLSGVEGVPVFLERPTPFSLRMSNVPGRALAGLKRGEVSPLFMERLEELFARVHERGVAHGDAHKRNILIDDDRPYLIDFSTAFVRGRMPVLDKILFNWFQMLDQERLYKVRKSFFDGGTPPRMFFLYRLIKRLKKWKQ